MVHARRVIDASGLVLLLNCNKFTTITALMPPYEKLCPSTSKHRQFIKVYCKIDMCNNHFFTAVAGYEVTAAYK